MTAATPSAAASPPETASAASPSAEAEVMPVAQEQESSLVRCCHGHGMQRRVFPKYQIIICATCNTRFEVPKEVPAVQRSSGWFCGTCYSQEVPAWKCDQCSEMFDEEAQSIDAHQEEGVAPAGSEPRARVPPLVFPEEGAPVAQGAPAQERVVRPQQPPKPKPKPPPAPAAAKAIAIECSPSTV